MASNSAPGTANAPRGPRNFNPPSGSLPNGLAASRYATDAPDAPTQARARPPVQRPILTRPQTNSRSHVVPVQSPTQFIPRPQVAIGSVAALIPGHAQVVSHPPQAASVAVRAPVQQSLGTTQVQRHDNFEHSMAPSDTESLKIRLDQAESAKKVLEKQLDESDDALKSARKVQDGMAKMLGERKGEIDNAKWRIEDLEMAKEELEKELAKKKLGTASDERAAKAASGKKAFEDMMREKEDSFRRAGKKIAEAKVRVNNAEERASAAERQSAEAQGHVQTLTAEIFSQKKLVKQSEEEVEQLRVEMEGQKKLVAKAESEAAQLRTELEQQMKLVTQAQHEVEQLRTEVENQKELYTVAKNEARHLRGEINSLTAKLDDLEAFNNSRKVHFATLEEENQTLKAEMAKLTKLVNNSLHAFNAAKNEIKDQELAILISSTISTESGALEAQGQVEETKVEERESIPFITARAENRTGRRTSPLQRWLANLVVYLTLVAILKPVPTVPNVKMFSQNNALTDTFFPMEQNQIIAKNESTWTFLPQPEPTPEITATANHYHASDPVKDFDTVSGNTTSPAQPAPGDTASDFTSLDRTMNWVAENPYKVAGWVSVCFSGGAAYYRYKHSACFQ